MPNSESDELHARTVVPFPSRPRTITAPAGLDLARLVEQEASAAISRNERIRQTALDLLIEAMGDAAEMVFADGARYTLEMVQREGFTIDPTAYPSLIFHKAPT